MVGELSGELQCEVPAKRIAGEHLGGLTYRPARQRALTALAAPAFGFALGEHLRHPFTPVAVLPVLVYAVICFVSALWGMRRPDRDEDWEARHERDEADRRRVVLTLSAKGRRVHDKIEMVAGTMEAEFLSVLTAEESKVLRSALSKLEQHSGVMFGRREGWYERRLVHGAASRMAKPGGALQAARSASSRAGSSRSRDAGR